MLCTYNFEFGLFRRLFRWFAFEFGCGYVLLVKQLSGYCCQALLVLFIWVWCLQDMLLIYCLISCFFRFCWWFTLRVLILTLVELLCSGFYLVVALIVLFSFVLFLLFLLVDFGAWVWVLLLFWFLGVLFCFGLWFWVCCLLWFATWWVLLVCVFGLRASGFLVLGLLSELSLVWYYSACWVYCVCCAFSFDCVLRLVLLVILAVVVLFC